VVVSLRRIGSALFGGLLLAAAAAFAASPASNDALDAQLQRIFGKKEFEATRFGPFRWADGGKAFTILEAPEGAPAEPEGKGAKDLVRYDALTGERRVLIPAARLSPGAGQPPLSIEDYAVSDDGKRMLLFTNAKKVWREKTRGDYWVLELASGALHKIGEGFPESTLMFAKFSPDGGRVAYVQANDLYVEDVAGGARTRLTTDGSATLINGTSDWVNEEELRIRDAFRWSPDGRAIAFWHFDASGIGTFDLINDTDSTYPTVKPIPYPKAGTTNSAVRIGVVPAAGGPTIWADLPGDPRNTYVARMEWVDASQLMLQQLNRRQNANDVWLVDASTGRARRMFRDEDQAWVEVVNAWQWLPGGRELLWVSERDGWRHAWAVSKDTGAFRLLTPGEFDIATVEGVDAKAGLLYFIASPGDSPRRFLYRTRLDGKGKPERVTPAEFRGGNAYKISPDGRFAIHTFSTAVRPPVVSVVTLPEHRTLRVLQDNKALAAKAAEIFQPPTEFFTVDIGGGVTLDAWMMTPKNLDPSKKYPLLMYVYGEPAGAQVMDHWDGNRALFHRALADAGYVVGCVDNRGTPALKGRAWRKSIYGEVGVLATAEQTAAVKALLASRPYLDLERVASWGWSGGGSMTLNLLFRSPDVYKVGMAVAPVPDQALYDTIYQERYMGLPQDNADGYKKGSPVNYAEGLKGKLLLVHGSGDDNVHYQGSERLVNRLIALDRSFDFMVYPNRTHAINEGENTSLHLHQLLARYLMTNLPAGPR